MKELVEEKTNTWWKGVYVFFAAFAFSVAIVIDWILAQTVFAEFKQESWIPLFFTVALAVIVTWLTFIAVKFLYKSSQKC